MDDPTSIMPLIIFLIVLVVAAAISIVCAVIRHKYTKFVKEHSFAIKQLKAINSTYKFYRVPVLNMQHSYDSADFYPTVSCLDYLIYQLQFKQNEFKNAIEATNRNLKLYLEYKEVVRAQCVFNKFDTQEIPKNTKRVSKYEERNFNKLLLKPTVIFRVRITLYREKMNGVVQARKSAVFDKEQVLGIIDQLNNRKGNFYCNEEIWNSICRVERAKVSNKMRFSILARDHHRCRKCGSRYGLEIDHIVPIAKGGKSTYDNLQTLCHRCNKKKGTDTIEY